MLLYMVKIQSIALLKNNRAECVTLLSKEGGKNNEYLVSAFIGKSSQIMFLATRGTDGEFTVRKL